MVHLLAEVERKSLVLDVQKGDAKVYDFEGILEPTYPSLLDSFVTFNKIAGEVLSKAMDRL